MNVTRLGIKFFLEEPLEDVRTLVPVFHTWIQKQAIEGHLLIDVHDYSHVHHGPGILLVGHHGNFSLDQGDGRQGLLYYRKQTIDDGSAAPFAPVLKTALEGCKLLEGEPSFNHRVRFRIDELLILANDRLNMPNDNETLDAIRPFIMEALSSVLPGEYELTQVAANSKVRLTIHARVRPTGV